MGMKRFYCKLLIMKRLRSWLFFFVNMHQWKKANKICDTMDRLSLDKWYYWLLTGI